MEKPKWNSIVGKQTEVPSQKSASPLKQTRRESNDSILSICLKSDSEMSWKDEKLQSMLEFRDPVEEIQPIQSVAPNISDEKNSDDLASSLYKAIWKGLDAGYVAGQSLSPSRSLGDWKIVGSLSPNRQIDPIDQLLEDRDGSSGFSSVDNGRRLRSASVVGDILLGNIEDFSVLNLSTPCQSPVLTILNENSGKNLDSGGQTPQLPITLHAEIGVSNAEEATEIFKRSSLDSTLEDDIRSDSSVLQGSSVKYFNNYYFGPVSVSVFPATTPVGKGSLVAPLSANIDRRHSSLLGFGNWPLSAGVGGGSRPGDMCVVPLNVDDYFGESLSLYPPKRFNIFYQRAFREPVSISRNNNRFPRRNSHVAEDVPEPEVLFPSQLTFSDGPRGTSSAGYSGGSGLTGIASPYLHCSSGSLNAYGDFEEAFMQIQGQEQPCHYSQTLESSFSLNSYYGSLWAVEFKSGRTEIFYVFEQNNIPLIKCRTGELVIVEADRGEDLGKITAEISVATMKTFISTASAEDSDILKEADKNQISSELATLLKSKEIIPKRIHRLALSADLKLLQAKAQEESLAMVRCQSRIRQKKLPMEVVDAEYQWDRNKLTFFFIADRRIDFRELVRDLFRIYKTRIWMCAVDKHSPRMINYLGGLVPVHHINDTDTADFSAISSLHDHM